MDSTHYANRILAFLQNIEDENDAKEFVRIALDALEYSANHTNNVFCKTVTTNLIADIDRRIERITP